MADVSSRTAGQRARADLLDRLYIESSRGTGRVLIPALSVLAAERATPGAGGPPHACASPRPSLSPPRTPRTPPAWPTTDWALTHPAAIAWQAAKTGEPVTVLSLTPEAYEGTGIHPLDPT
ncbi:MULTISPECIES: hypothetical protein [Actinomycetes]|uniref:hypothetical protein n=1 Tax=Actinomycetes TaxID=1760 RepID=UPI0036684808